MKNNIIKVNLWDKEICRLSWQGGYKKGFGKIGAKVSFNPEYHTFGFDVDPLGPFSATRHFVREGMSDICRVAEYEGLPRFLSGSLPDDWGNLVFSSWISSNNLRISDVTPVDKLAFIGKRGMGALEFMPASYTPSANDSVALDELYSLAKEIEASRNEININLKDNPAIKDMMEVGISAGGKHPKAIVAINNETGEVRSGQVPTPEGFTHYILKFKDFNSWPTAEIEYCYFLMARACGIEIENSSMIKIAGENHFITERFDRKNGEKIHSATLMALHGETSAYEDIFYVCRSLGLGQSAIYQLFKRVVFNYLACVCDDHDKNFSFLLTKDGKWHLAPAYDITFTYNFLNAFISDRHCMTVGGKDRLLSMDDLRLLGEENDIDNVQNIVEGTVDVIQDFRSKLEDLTASKRTAESIYSRINLQIEALTR